jgi:hypothetical protein
MAGTWFNWKGYLQQRGITFYLYMKPDNQCLSPLKLWVQILFMSKCTRYTIMHMWLATGQLFSPGTLLSSTNKTDHHDIAEILLKLALSTITLTPSTRILVYYSFSIYEWIRCRTIKNIKYFFSNLTTGNTVINMFHVTASSKQFFSYNHNKKK